MSLQTPCPHSGRRPVHEFMDGEVADVRVTDPDARDVERAFTRNNPDGLTTLASRRRLPLMANSAP